MPRKDFDNERRPRFAVSAKHKETKQYYTLYNTFDDTKLYLSKELSLLNSIQDNYNEYVSINVVTALEWSRIYI